MFAEPPGSGHVVAEWLLGLPNCLAICAPVTITVNDLMLGVKNTWRIIICQDDAFTKQNARFLIAND